MNTRFSTALFWFPTSRRKIEIKGDIEDEGPVKQHNLSGDGTIWWETFMLVDVADWWGAQEKEKKMRKDTVASRWFIHLPHLKAFPRHLTCVNGLLKAASKSRTLRKSITASKYFRQMPCAPLQTPDRLTGKINAVFFRRSTVGGGFTSTGTYTRPPKTPAPCDVSFSEESHDPWWEWNKQLPLKPSADHSVLTLS